ncbi:YcaO-like family protein [Zooshikella marina]|uniref:YcaO-like family protein n=1 Tax=Zooshikella ganghwensis TaxID=202772 RepID=UPI001BAFC975|nr:YcaO-like family protein [Zooshikella ganghwensis]MBU2704455.1 YcaO-like family protein [Zooshikella ganghwensis]
MNNKKIFDADRHVVELESTFKQYTDSFVIKKYPITYSEDTYQAMGDRAMQFGPLAAVKQPPEILLAGKPLLNHWGEQLKIATALEGRTIQHYLAIGADSIRQLESMDKNNIHQAMIFSSFAQLVVNHNDLPAYAAIAYAKGFNQWLYDFCKEDTNRLIGAALISRQDPSTLLEQLYDILQLGYRVLHLRPEVIAGYDLGHKVFNVFWQACEANNITIAFHGGTHLHAPTAGTDRYSTHFALHACSHPIEAQMAFLSLLETGVFERHPMLRFVFLEAGTSWVPYWLWRLDNICYPEYPVLIKNNIKMLPSEYFKRQCWVAIELGEPCLREAINYVGCDRLIYGTDFPHPDHLQFTTKDIASQLSDLNETELNAILVNNAKECYGLNQDLGKKKLNQISDAKFLNEIKSKTKDKAECGGEEKKQILSKKMQQQNGLPSEEQCVLEKPLSWHPKFNLYKFYRNDVLLIGEASQFLIKKNQFPYASLIDGVCTGSNIIKKQLLTQLLEEGAKFIYQIKQLMKQGLITVNEKCESNFIKPLFDTMPANECIYYTSAYKILNLSLISTQKLAGVYRVIEKLYESKNFCFVNFLLVDDFLDPRLLQQNYDTNWLVIKITGERLWVSPCFSSIEKDYFSFLCQRICANQSARAFMMEVYPEANHSYPFSNDLRINASQLRELELIIRNKLSVAIDSVYRTLTVYHLASSQVTQHLLPSISANHISLADQIDQTIKLQSCKVYFEKDGGSRTVSSKETLNKLMKVVSPITGLITHIEDISPNSEQPIRIFRTGFFKKPALCESVMLDQDDFVQICLGKGISIEQAKVSGLCEALERSAALYQGNEPKIFAKPAQLEKRYYTYQQLAPYSEDQYAQFVDPHYPKMLQKHRVKLYNNSTIHWLPTWSLTSEERVYVPFTCCFSNTPLPEEQYGRWNSNGCAAGNTLEEAILQGLYELIERDATAIWWYNRIPSPAFDAQCFNQKHMQLIHSTLNSTHRFWVLDITTDIEVPVMAAIAQDKKTSSYCLGFGCHLQPQLAAQRALTELCQLIPIRENNAAPFDFNAIQPASYLHPGQHRHSMKPFAQSSGDIKQDILNIVRKLKALNFETLVLNYSRADLPINTAKVFVPGLCHIWPQLANERLYSVPVYLGWLEHANSESSINAQGLFI